MNISEALKLAGDYADLHFYRTVMRVFGTENCGNDDPPTPRALRYKLRDLRAIERLSPDEAYGRDYRVVTSGNDGFEVWIGSAHRWDTHFSRAEVAALTRWLVWDWYVKTSWRRPVYYWALRRYVRSVKASMGLS